LKLKKKNIFTDGAITTRIEKVILLDNFTLQVYFHLVSAKAGVINGHGIHGRSVSDSDLFQIL